MVAFISILFIFSCLAISYLIYKNRQNKKEVSWLSTQLKNAHLAERDLQDELAILQSKLGSAIKDPLTNLLGWQLFEDRLNQNIKESSRYHLTLGLLYVDINDFKVVNDALGHETGDIVLSEVANRLEACVRQVDTVSRLTKDVFVVLLTQLNKPEMAAVVAQRMLQSIAEPMQVKDQQLYLTASIGIAVYPADGSDSSALLRSADYALHSAKEKGKQVYQFYQERINTNSQRELILSIGLRRETVTQEFTIYYQPIVNVHNETIFCMDVLLHWQHPDLGLIPPSEIFSCADKQNKLNVITEWLLESACRQFLSWRALGFFPRYLGIPLSIKQLENSQFIYRISQILKELQFNPEWLILEIKDDHGQISFDIMEKAINMLKYLNIKLAIDGFDASGLAFRHLKNLGFDFIKLDHGFINDIENNPQTVALMKSLIFMANNLSMQLIVQGLESSKQVTVLKDLGCTLMQGKLLGDALTEQEVATKMVIPAQE